MVLPSAKGPKLLGFRQGFPGPHGERIPHFGPKASMGGPFGLRNSFPRS